MDGRQTIDLGEFLLQLLELSDYYHFKSFDEDSEFQAAFDKFITACEELKPQIQKILSISSIEAEVHSDDHLYQVRFDATEYVAQASLEDLIEIAEAEWAYDLPLDRVALFYEDKIPEIKALLDYCRKTKGLRNQVGFECSISDEEDLLRWLKYKRPAVFRDLLPHTGFEPEHFEELSDSDEED